MNEKQSNFKFLYVTRERYPTFRVDLTELFSKGIAGKGNSIDWQMQAMHHSKVQEVQLNEFEKVYVGALREGKGLKTKIINQFYSLQNDFRISQLVIANDYDFVQVRDKILAAWIGLKAAQKKGIPFVYWMSFPYPEADLFRSKDPSLALPRTMRWFYRLRSILTGYILYKLVLPNADKIFVQSDRMLEDVALHGISKKCMFPVPMGINFDKVRDKKKSSINNEKLTGKEVLMYLGSLVRVRRIDFLLEMMPAVLRSRPNSVLLLVGDASKEDMQFLKKRADELGIDKQVVFTGFVPMEQGWDYVRISNLCLSPIRPSPILDASSPTKIVEYLALGKPVVANKNPDQSKVLNESGAGFAVDYTPKAFAEACLKILNSPEMSIEMGEKGINYIKQFRNYKMLSNSVENIYDELLTIHK